MQRKRTLLLFTLLFAMFAPVVRAQNYNPPTHALSPEVQQHVDMAYLLLNGEVSKDHLPMFLSSGGIPIDPSRTMSPLQEMAANKKTAPATKAFDQFYYLGMNTVGSWALNTSEGI